MNMVDFSCDLLTFTAVLFLSLHFFRMGTRSPLCLSWTPSKALHMHTVRLASPQSVLYLDHRQKPLIANALIAWIIYHYRLIQLDPYVILIIHCLADYLRILSTCLQDSLSFTLAQRSSSVLVIKTWHHILHNHFSRDK